MDLKGWDVVYKGVAGYCTVSVVFLQDSAGGGLQGCAGEQAEG